jgi:hypothetical protein
MLALIVISEMELESLLKESFAFLGNKNIIFNSLKEEPRSITRVEPSIVSTIMEIWLESMPHHFSEEHYDFSSFVLKTCNNQETSKCNESVSTPASHITC